jgi:hypothetical protein
MGGRSSRLTVRVAGGISDSGAPTGTNCVGASIDASYKAYWFEALKDSVTFSAAQLQHKGTETEAVSASTSESCGATTCDKINCSDDLTSPADVPTTCSNQQSFTGDLKVKLLP